LVIPPFYHHQIKRKKRVVTIGGKRKTANGLVKERLITLKGEGKKFTYPHPDYIGTETFESPNHGGGGVATAMETTNGWFSIKKTSNNLLGKSQVYKRPNIPIGCGVEEGGRISFLGKKGEGRMVLQANISKKGGEERQRGGKKKGL